MNIRKLCLTSLLIVVQAWAPAFAKSSSTEADAGCIECSGNYGRDPQAALERFIKNMQVITDGALHVDRLTTFKLGYNNRCNRFVDDGEYKDIGKEIIKIVNRPESEAIRKGSKDLHKLCPRYKYMKKDEKDGLWVLFAAGWAQKESSCNEHVPDADSTVTIHNGRPAILGGIIQMDKYHENKYNGGKFCKPGVSATAKGSFSCGFAMLNSDFKKGRSLFRSNAHWAVFRPHTDAADFIKKSIRNYPYCTQTPKQIAAAERKKSKRVAQR